jgi:hypothetical protein
MRSTMMKVVFGQGIFLPLLGCPPHAVCQRGKRSDMSQLVPFVASSLGRDL